MIKQIAKQFIKNIINGKVIVGEAIGVIFMYFCLHFSIYNILVSISIQTLIFLLLISITTISQVVLKSKKNN